MPPNNPQRQGHRARPPVQRRVFPTDGRLPPKKTVRPKVKYQPAGNNDQKMDAADTGPPGRDDEVGESDGEEDMQQLSLDGAGDDSGTDEMLQEVHHLQRRIQNVQLALQTSQGLSNPEKWRTNCLLPVRNAVKEWRSILKYHFADDTQGNDDDGNKDEAEKAIESTDGIDCNDRQELLHSTAQSVYGLIQMSMQTGPLVGSNPGYFKRCGGEVASVACHFLNEVVAFADVEAKQRAICNHGGNGQQRVEPVTDIAEYVAAQHAAGVERPRFTLVARGNTVPAEDAPSLETVQDAAICKDANEDSDGSSIDSDSEHDNLSESGSSCSSTGSVEDSTQAQEETLPGAQGPPVDPSVNPRQMQTVCNLQTSFLFTEKQAQRLCQWLRNAERAKEQNKPPSKSAKKLQSQKSKKQKQKEQKRERNMKKKKRGGG